MYTHFGHLAEGGMPCEVLAHVSPAGRSFKFGQTTLEGHALAGEESFAIKWKPDNSVW